MILQRVKNLLWYPPSERKGRPLGSYSRTFPWKTLYYRVSVCSVPPLLLGVTGALIVRGPSGLAGFMLGTSIPLTYVPEPDKFLRIMEHSVRTYYPLRAGYMRHG